MKILLLGATGTIGREITELALARGHTVTAAVRTPALLALAHPALTARSIDVLDASSVTKALTGDHDVVVNATGPGGPGVSDKHLDVLTTGARHVADAMQAAGLRRLVALGSIATMPVDDAGTMLRDTPGFPPPFRPISGAHLQAWRTYREAGLDWTILCPAPAVLPEPARGGYRVHTRFALQGPLDLDGPVPTITAGDLAELLLDIAEEGSFLHQRVTAAY